VRFIVKQAFGVIDIVIWLWATHLISR